MYNYGETLNPHALCVNFADSLSTEVKWHYDDGDSMMIFGFSSSIKGLELRKEHIIHLLGNSGYKKAIQKVKR